MGCILATRICDTGGFCIAIPLRFRMARNKFGTAVVYYHPPVSSEAVREYAEAHGLHRVGARPPLREYIKDTWNRRDFAIAMAAFSNEASYARNRLGRWWTVLLPTLQAMTYGVIFGVILGSNRPSNFFPFLFTGVFLFSFCQFTFASGATSLTSNAGLVRSTMFPRALLPISAVIAQLLDLIPQYGLLAILAIAIQHTISWQWLIMIPITILMAMFATGLALISARLTVHISDLSKLIPFLTRITFYVSGIFFHVDQVLAGHPNLLTLAHWNPVYDYIQLARGVLVVGYELNPDLWLPAITWAVVLLFFGFIFFWRAEDRYGRD